MEAGELYGAVSQGMERKSSLDHAEEPRLIAGGFFVPRHCTPARFTDA